MTNIVDCNYFHSLFFSVISLTPPPKAPDVVDVLQNAYKSDDFGPGPTLTQTTMPKSELLIFTGQLNVFLLL